MMTIPTQLKCEESSNALSEGRVSTQIQYILRKKELIYSTIIFAVHTMKVNQFPREITKYIYIAI